MDLHVYRNSQDRWRDLRSAAREHGAVLAINAVTFQELVERITPDVKAASLGQRFVLIQEAMDHCTSPAAADCRHSIPGLTRYAYDAITELKAARVRPAEVRAAGAALLGDVLERYDDRLRQSGFVDPQDLRLLAGSRVVERAVPWLQKFSRVVLHALYDLTEADFHLLRCLIEALPEGGAVVLFNATANVKPTQFAEWTWQRFVQNESLAEKTFPDFCRASNPTRPVLERLFDFQSAEPLPVDDSLRIVEAPGRYKEIERIGGDITDLLMSGESPNDIAVAVRHMDHYGEMIEDVLTRYGIPHRFETGVPLLRNPFIKYWLAVLDLVTSERSREALARVMASAYYEPRLSPDIDVERDLASFGYIDRHHLPAAVLARRRGSRWVAELERFGSRLDELETASGSFAGFLSQFPPSPALTQRDAQAWRSLRDELQAVDVLLCSDDNRHMTDKQPGAELTFTRFRRIVSGIAALLTTDRLSSTPVPPGLPRVRIITPHALGSREYKWIFAPGMADGEFPARGFGNPLLPDATIEAINLTIRPRRLMTSRDRNRREPLYLFLILDSALKRVTLTYPASTIEGEAIYPSAYIAEIARHYAESPIVRAATGNLVPRAEDERLSRIAEEWRQGSFADERARELLGADIVARANVEKKGASRARLSRNLLRLDGPWHPSELNSLSECPFVFLARHRLKLRASETPDFEVPALEIGILAHSILRDFYSQPVPASIEEARSRMNEIIVRRLSAADIEGQGPYSMFDPSLWKIRRQQLVSVLNQYVHFAVRDARDGFQTQSEYLDSPLPAATLGQARLAGKPDHVAVHRAGGRIDAIRIDDFKYSAASSSTARQLKQSFQIPVYAYLAVQALGAEPGVHLEGRYLLLRSPGNPVVSNVIDHAALDEVRTRIDGLLERVREGRMEPDPADRQNCVDCDYRRLCRFYGG